MPISIDISKKENPEFLARVLTGVGVESKLEEGKIILSGDNTALESIINTAKGWGLETEIFEEKEDDTTISRFSDSRISYHFETKTLTVGKKEYELSDNEHIALTLLLKNYGKIIHRQEFIERGINGNNSDEGLNVYDAITSLREKIEENPKEHVFLKGYKWSNGGYSYEPEGTIYLPNYKVGSFTINLKTNIGTYSNRTGIRFSDAQARILESLCKQKDTQISSSNLATIVYGSVNQNTLASLSTAIFEIKKKTSNRLIEGRREEGYMINSKL